LHYKKELKKFLEQQRETIATDTHELAAFHKKLR
jgi:hypothetical protein